MSARSIRRAAEHKSRKEAARAAHVEGPRTAGPRSEEGRLAQAAFAQHIAAARLGKSGPNTPEGKAKSCLNAVKTGLTGRTVLLSSDDAALYQQHVQQFADEYQPVGPFETNLVQALADTAWRLLRIPALEMAVFASGHEQFAENFADRDPELQPGLLQMHTFLHYEKQLRNLQIQEARLRRNREKDTAELRRLQQQRREKEETDLALAPVPKTVATSRVPPPEEFEFSTEELEAKLNYVDAYVKAAKAA